MSLRARVLWGFAVVIAVLLAAGVAIVVAERNVLVGQIDDRLASVEKLVVKIGRAEAAAPGSLAAARVPPALSGLYVGVVGAGGSLTTVTTPDGGDALAPVITTPLVPGVPETVPTAGASPGGMRVVEYVGGGRTRVVAGAPLDDVRAATTRLTEILLLVLAVCLVVIGTVVFWVLRLGVAPISRVTGVARAISAGDASQRVEAFPPGTEAQELGQAFNLLVDANAASEERLRRFVADASHELRTPLATLTGYSSLYAAGGLTDQAAVADAMARIRHEAGRMQVLVDDLLLLAALDRDPTVAREPVDLAPLVAGLVADLRVVAADRHVTLESPPSLPVMGDEPRLVQALAVLTSNAVRHTPPGTPIHVRATTGAGRTRIEVLDSGPGIAEADLPRVFDRFYRADAARARDTGGVGLGLSIAAAITAAHGGDIGAAPLQPQGTVFWIDLPSA